jgi:hypothetical protein
VQVQEERGQGAFERRARAAGDAEPRAGQLRGPGEIQDAHRLAEILVVFRLERQRRRAAMPADLDAEVLAVPVRNLVQRQVRDAEQQLPKLSGGLITLGIRRPDLLLQLPRPVLQLCGAPALAAGRLLHLPCHRPGLLPESVGCGDARRAAGEQRFKLIEVQLVAAPREAGNSRIAHLQQRARIVHQRPSLSSRPPAPDRAESLCVIILDYRMNTASVPLAAVLR